MAHLWTVLGLQSSVCKDMPRFTPGFQKFRARSVAEIQPVRALSGLSHPNSCDSRAEAEGYAI